ncbi:MAG TPA: glycosyltransferase family 87 protein [Terracidiphilus sp.]|nr:glycosyltransferase family 87 protein [Terracidiphilus sp.]
MSRLGPRLLLLFLVAAALGGLYTEWRVNTSFVGESDFPGYYTAALLVRGGHSAQIYSSQLNADPTAVGSDPHSYFARAAAARGIVNVPLYDYTPALADLLAPFTFLPPVAALWLWEAATFLFLIGSGILLARLLGLHTPGLVFLVTALVLFFRPTVATFVYGQVMVFLLFLVLGALYYYMRGRGNWAGFLIALAISIKLTPLVLVIPLVAWRDWKTLRAVALSCLGIFAALWLVNGPQALNLYFLHRLPAMSHAFIDLTNLNLRTALQVLWYGGYQAVPSADSLWAGRLLSLLVLLFAGWLVRARRSFHWGSNQRVLAASCFLLFSACMSPIAWRHAYVMAVPALLFLGRRIWRGRARPLETALVLFFILALSTDKFTKWAWHIQGRGLFVLAMAPPVLAAALGLLELNRLRREQSTPERAQIVFEPATSEVA